MYLEISSVTQTRKDERRSSLILQPSSLIISGADEKNRTSTASRQQASETCASTSSATSARFGRISRILIRRPKFKRLQFCSRPYARITAVRFCYSYKKHKCPISTQTTGIFCK